MNVVVDSLLTCPHCGFAAQETMPIALIHWRPPIW
jgi:hypothetical protein